MKYTIQIRGWGYEISAGNTTKEIWKYIQEECHGDAGVYRDKLDEGEVPENLQIWPDFWDAINCPDLKFMECGPDANATVCVEDEDGNTVYEASLDDLSDEAKTEVEELDMTGSEEPYWTADSEEKGTWLCATFEADKFDPGLVSMKKSCLAVGSPHDTSWYVVFSGFSYDGKEILDDGFGTEGKGSNLHVYPEG